MTLSVGLVLTSTLSCALVTGFVFTYAVIVMPGLAKLTDKEFIRPVQVTDELIQNNQPILKDFNYGRDGLSHIADNSFNRYALQQNVYKFILEKYYDKKISSMNLLVLHPNYTNYVHLKLPEMKKPNIAFYEDRVLLVKFDHYTSALGTNMYTNTCINITF